MKKPKVLKHFNNNSVEDIITVLEDINKSDLNPETRKIASEYLKEIKEYLRENSLNKLLKDGTEI